MEVLFSGSLCAQSGGPALSSYLSMKGLLSNGVKTDIVMAPLIKNQTLVADDVNIYYTSKVLNYRFGYIYNLRKQLDMLPKYDLYHIQGIWQYLGHSVASFSRKKGRPYIITLRGMMYPQAMNHSSFIKKVSLLLYQRNDLEKAACIQATCVEEMQHYRDLGFTNPVAVIPNPIETKGVIDREIKLKNKFRIGYLGRIHPRKRIERIIYAIAQLKDEMLDVELVIIGADDLKYEQFLRDEVNRLGLNNVTFTGFLSGNEKDKSIMDLSLLVVPSDFENFGNIVTEALVRGVPVIASKGMPWHDLEEYKCGWWINNDQDTINKTILEAYKLSKTELIEMGNNGKRLIMEKYSVDTLGKRMKELYEWILTKENKPGFVYE